MSTSVIWFGNDLRLVDNPAVNEALRRSDQVVPVYIHAPEEAAPWSPGAASRWWLHHSLQSLADDLGALGTSLVIRCGDSATVLRDVARASGARTVYWNYPIEPKLRQRDRRVVQTLTAASIRSVRCGGARLFEPGSILTAADTPYRMFTPFWNNCLKRGFGTPPAAKPSHWKHSEPALSTVPLEALELLAKTAWDAGLRGQWRPGEAGAHDCLERFCGQAALDYGDARDFPAKSATSRLSPHLHFGEISPRQVVARMHEYRAQQPSPAVTATVDSVLRQLGWREFAQHLLFHFPHTSEAVMNRRFAGFPWRRNNAHLSAWQRGQTGIPIIDAGMRELWHSGWMHNRVRMLVASFLSKNCGISWTEGARWFWDTLVDADLANNSLGWQWVAGTGADAAPYFRIFNPVSQAQKFDADGDYVRRWVPEITALPQAWLHQPWRAPIETQRASRCVIGVDYPAPIVDLTASRQRALATYRRHSAG